MRVLIGTVVLGVVMIAGCEDLVLDSDEHTAGEYSRVAFHYKRSCFFGCTLEQPLLAGTREAIGVSGAGNDEGVRAVSSDPDVAVFAVERECACERNGSRVVVALDAMCADDFRKVCENMVLVEAKAEGDASLTLEAEGDVLDRITVQVREVDRGVIFATVEDQLGSLEVDTLELAAGETAVLEVELYDALGRKLLAPEGVIWRVQDETVATVSGFLTGARAEIEAGLDADVQAVASGATTLTVDVAGADVGLELRVR